MKIRPIALAVCALFLFARVAAAQATFDSLAGPWWFSLSGKDKGALIVSFNEPNGGAFAVTDVELTEHPSFGFSRAAGAFFQIAADQALALDAKGNVMGTLTLSAPGGGGALGSLTLLKGKPNKTFTKLKLSATLDVGGGPLNVKLTGVRPTDFPVLTGHAAAAGLSGKGAKSKTMDLGVTSDVDLGLPAYTFTAHGPIDLDKVPVADTTLSGQVMVDPKFKAYGLLVSSSDFGTGAAKGTLKLPSKAATTPKLALTLEADRKLKLKGTLTDPIEPILSVTPISADFGASHLGDVHTKSFQVSNAGVGMLSGAVSFVADSDDFALVGTPTYLNLEPNDPPVTIVAIFQPESMGNKSATLRFGTTTSIGSKLVNLKGVGGLAEISVDPAVVAFDDTATGASRSITITVTNDGDGPLTGRARLTGSGAFVLVEPPNTIGVSQISYTIDPGDSRTFDVRFSPTSGSDFTGNLNLTGGGGEDLPVMGSGF